MITKDNISEFKKLYLSSVSDGKDIFMFGGNEVLTSYAKYVIEYFNCLS
jgi:hypothetical protein|tara:strand:- start:32 stop:178 length:147 start_codon:yes stop_codon:yes gene_type:complete